MAKFNDSRKKPSQRGSRSMSSNKRTTSSEISEPMRLNKYVAHCGICARRKADEFIKDGQVKVNETIILEPGHKVLPKDKVYFKGELIQPVQNMVYILLNKPRNCISTVSDERGRRTVIDIVGRKVKERIFPVGRLDRETTGLILLTNDGTLAKRLSHPSHKVQKVYRVVLDKKVEKNHLEQIRNGLTLEDGFAEVDFVTYVENRGGKEINIELHIGKNRIVRRIFEYFGYVVEKLDRIYYAGLTKKDVPRGWFRELTEREIIMLKHFTN